MAQFRRTSCVCVFWQKKTNSQKEISVVGSQVPGPPKIIQSARILRGEKIMKLRTPIESSLGDSKTKRFGGSGLVHACLDSSEEIDCPSSNTHNLGPFASIELIFFCLNRSII